MEEPIGGARFTVYLKLSLLWVTILLSFSSASILVLLSEAGALPCAFWRVTIAASILWAARFLTSPRIPSKPDPRIILYSCLSGFALAVHFLLWMESLFLIPVAVSTTIVVTYPLLSVIPDMIVFREEPTPLQILGLTLGFLGVILFTQPWVLGGYDVRGVILSFAGALAATCYFSLGRLLRREVSLLDYGSLTYSSASLSLLAYGLAARDNIVYHSIHSYLYFILLALIPMIGGHTLLNYMLRYVKTSIATSVALGEPIGASILAYIALGQEVSLVEASVMCLTLSSVALTLIEEARVSRINV
ncbi:MAG: DMT family transporter [Candidatus Bathyarchaeia archaeon]